MKKRICDKCKDPSKKAFKHQLDIHRTRWFGLSTYWISLDPIDLCHDCQNELRGLLSDFGIAVDEFQDPAFMKSEVKL